MDSGLGCCTTFYIKFQLYFPSSHLNLSDLEALLEINYMPFEILLTYIFFLKAIKACSTMTVSVCHLVESKLLKRTDCVPLGNTGMTSFLCLEESLFYRHSGMGNQCMHWKNIS